MYRPLSSLDDEDIFYHINWWNCITSTINQNQVHINVAKIKCFVKWLSIYWRKKMLHNCNTTMTLYDLLVQKINDIIEVYFE